MTTNAKLLIAAMIILAALAACSAPPDPNPTLIGPLPPAPNVGALGAPTPTFSAIVRAPTPAATGGLAGSREVRRISPADAKKLLDEGKALLYDVRSAQSYEAKHAAGALLMPIDAEGAPDGAKLPKDKTLIFYCT
jgi:hypothetical protein